MLCFFSSLIDFDWIKGHLISGRVRSDQFDFLKKLGRIEFRSGSNPNESDGFLRSGRILPPVGLLTDSNALLCGILTEKVGNISASSEKQRRSVLTFFLNTNIKIY
jgi:hypothetical protein